MKNKGKVFEENFKKSVPNDILFYRFRDGTANFFGQKNENVRFQQKNMCDCMIFDGEILFLLELKSHLGKSLPFKDIKKNQIEELSLKQYYKNVVCGIIIDFRELEEDYFIFIEDITDFMRKSTRKSFPVEWCREKGIKIENKKLISNYRYNVNKMLTDIKGVKK